MNEGKLDFDKFYFLNCRYIVSMNEELNLKFEELKKSKVVLESYNNKFKEVRKDTCITLLKEIKEEAKNRGLNFKEFCLQKGYTDHYVANTLNNARASIQKLEEFKKIFFEKI